MIGGLERNAVLFRLLTTLCLTSSLWTGCANQSGNVNEDENAVAAALGLGQGESVPSIKKPETAEENWVLANEAFEKEKYVKAQRYYLYLRSNFPYSKFALDAQVRIADCQFRRKRYLEAIDGYNRFVRIHRTNKLVGHARYMIAQSYYKRTPSRWFFLTPAPEERDQEAVNKAAEATDTYLRLHKGHERYAEAEKMMEDLRGRVIRHERLVANFYRRQRRWPGYVGRLEEIRRKYPKFGETPKLLVELTQGYFKMEKYDEAEAIVAKLEKTYPDAKRELAKARKVVSKRPAEVEEKEPESSEVESSDDILE